MLYVAICDDEIDTLNCLSAQVKEYLKNNKETAEITEYSQSRMLLYDIQEGKYFDLILTDIEMPHIDGMNLAAQIKRILSETLILFITAHVKYAVDAYELSIFRYIPKNLLSERLEHALRDAVSMIHLQSSDYYIINMPSRVEKIPYKKILHIKREGKNSVIELVNGSITRVRKSLLQLYTELDSKDFVYIDRGTIVNLAHIVSIKEGMVELKNNVWLAASHAKVEEIKDRLCVFWGEKI